MALEVHRNKERVGPFLRNKVTQGDCAKLVRELPNDSVDILVTSPPYWGQRTSLGVGVEEDPRSYLHFLVEVFDAFLPKLKKHGIVWINLGDAYNTPVNWRYDDRRYSTLGAEKTGLSEENTAYTKPRLKRKAFVDKSESWLTYGNLLALPSRLIVGLCDIGYLFRGEVIWRKRNPMPEGRCRRPHRQHEPVFLLAKDERHQFRTTPPVPSVWEFANEKLDGHSHRSRFPEELPRRCIEAFGQIDSEVLVLDPFSGSGTTGIAAKRLGCSYLGFEIDSEHVDASNNRLEHLEPQSTRLFTI